MGCQNCVVHKVSAEVLCLAFFRAFWKGVFNLDFHVAEVFHTLKFIERVEHVTLVQVFGVEPGVHTPSVELIFGIEVDLPSHKRVVKGRVFEGGDNIVASLFIDVNELDRNWWFLVLVESKVDEVAVFKIV